MPRAFRWILWENRERLEHLAQMVSLLGTGAHLSGKRVNEELTVAAAVTAADWRPWTDDMQIILSKRMPQPQAQTKGIYCLRLFALACTTLCGVYFLGGVFLLASAYNHTERHFPLFITWHDFSKTILAGVGFLCAGIMYLVLARKAKSA